MTMTTLNSTVLFMSMRTYETMMNTDGFKKKNLIFDIHPPNQFEQFWFYERIDVQQVTEIVETQQIHLLLDQ